MHIPDYEAAKNYALQRLENELSDDLLYHSIRHTRDDVVPASSRLADMEGVSKEDRMLLLTAAWFHDIGFVERYTDNERIAARIATEVLPGFGYSPQQIEIIQGIIMATKLPQTPHNLLEEIMADADLDNLGRADFFVISDHLRVEMAVRGQKFTAEAWYQQEIDFLSSHQYFTAAARKLRDAGKQKNLQVFQELLKNS